MLNQSNNLFTRAALTLATLAPAYAKAQEDPSSATNQAITASATLPKSATPISDLALSPEFQAKVAIEQIKAVNEILERSGLSAREKAICDDLIAVIWSASYSTASPKDKLSMIEISVKSGGNLSWLMVKPPGFTYRASNTFPKEFTFADEGGVRPIDRLADLAKRTSLKNELDPQEFITSLVSAMGRPKTMSQEDKPFCHVVAMLFHLNSNNPWRYLRLSHQLATTGSAPLSYKDGEALGEEIALEPNWRFASNNRLFSSLSLSVLTSAVSNYVNHTDPFDPNSSDPQGTDFVMTTANLFPLVAGTNAYLDITPEKSDTPLPTNSLAGLLLSPSTGLSHSVVILSDNGVTVTIYDPGAVTAFASGDNDLEYQSGIVGHIHPTDRGPEVILSRPDFLKMCKYTLQFNPNGYGSTHRLVNVSWEDLVNEALKPPSLDQITRNWAADTDTNKPPADPAPLALIPGSHQKQSNSTPWGAKIFLGLIALYTAMKTATYGTRPSHKRKDP